MKKTIILSLIVIFVFAFVGCSSKDASTTLNVYNWGDYIDPDVIKDFEKEYDIKINYEEFATNEEMLAKIQAGGTSYDVIFPSEYMIESMIQRDLLHELDFSKLDNIKNIGKQYQNQAYDKEQ